MKKLIFCLLAIAFSFTSYALTAEETPTTRVKREDTTYFVHKNIKYMKLTSHDDADGRIGRKIQNIDVKYVGDEKTRFNNGYNNRPGGLSGNMGEYYKNAEEKVQNDVVAIFCKYIKDNFTVKQKAKLLNDYKSKKQSAGIYFITLEINGSYVEGIWIMEDNGNFSDIDLANLDMLIRKNMIMKTSGSNTQRTCAMHATVGYPHVIPFLEKELQQAK